MIPFERESDFGVVEKAQADYFDPESGELILGDIIISADKVTEQADAFGHSPICLSLCAQPAASVRLRSHAAG